MSLKDFRGLQSDWKISHIDCSLLDASLNRLGGEFRRLLSEHSVPLPMSSQSSPGPQACISPLPLPLAVIQKLQAILSRLIMDKRLERCLSIYAKVLSSNVRASLQALGMESYIAQWGKHLEFNLKHLFTARYKLCDEVFERLGMDAWRDYSATIAVRAGIPEFMQLGMAIAKGKKDPKLFKAARHL
ncbi:hypothetical protein MLD38_015199 [Melastoma candidum]|uniref:Uncharacterized protein n=1 Tax=Melastoma candidum TaxID=119954 RepID=A0ACB9RFX4_9MYRT|nr:hypothetical protein MLD38_015199 [Melastoma candidum]